MGTTDSSIGKGKHQINGICTYCHKKIIERNHFQKAHNMERRNIGCFRKGNPSYWKGKTIQTNSRLKQIHDKRIKTIRKNPNWLCKENNPNWKGGISLIKCREIRKQKYSEWRTQVFKRDKYICRMCGYDKGKILNAHHIIPWRLDKTKMYEIDNGITLCIPCHKKTIYKEEKFIDYFNNILKGENHRNNR